MHLSSSVGSLLRQIVAGKERVLILGLLGLNWSIIWPITCHMPIFSKKLTSAHLILGVFVVGFGVGLGTGLH